MAFPSHCGILDQTNNIKKYFFSLKLKSYNIPSLLVKLYLSYNSLLQNEIIHKADRLYFSEKKNIKPTT